MVRVIKNILHLINACLAALYYRFPAGKLYIIAVTGTSGKTTLTHLIYEILKSEGEKVSMISTIAAQINGQKIDTGFHVTTPTPWDLQRFLRKSADGGSNYFVLETSSHALDQHRTWGIKPEIAVITNISHEHLDYHETLGNYRKSKAHILKGANYCVLNIDDKNYLYLKKNSRGQTVTFGLQKEADYSTSNIKLKTQLPGIYNLYNCLAAYAVASIVRIDKDRIIEAIARFKGIPGRMEEVKSQKPFRIFIDFAHKPDALEQVLITVRSMTDNKIIIVYGCAGLRDKLKRPMMGSIAGRLADYIVLTAEDPRTEDVRSIIDDIAIGSLKAGAIEVLKKNKMKMHIMKGKRFIRIPDRQEAINFAIRNLAQKGDIVIITGKGHEKSMCYGKVEYPWDEKMSVMKALTYDPIKTSA